MSRPEEVPETQRTTTTRARTRAQLWGGRERAGRASRAGARRRRRVAGTREGRGQNKIWQSRCFPFRVLVTKKKRSRIFGLSSVWLIRGDRVASLFPSPATTLRRSRLPVDPRVSSRGFRIVVRGADACSTSARSPRRESLASLSFGREVISFHERPRVVPLPLAIAPPQLRWVLLILIPLRA